MKNANVKIQKNESTDKLNLSKVKANFDKGRSLEKDVPIGKRGIYKSHEDTSSRNKLRREIRNFFFDLTSKDRSNELKSKRLNEFFIHYKEKYSLNDLSVGSICNTNKPMDLDDRLKDVGFKSWNHWMYSNSLCNYIKKVIE